MSIFTPINDMCRDCYRDVKPSERQEIVFDKDGRCRRLCARCIEKDDKKRKEAA